MVVANRTSEEIQKDVAESIRAVAEQGAERALFFAQNGRNQRRNESFSQFGAENSQNGNFRRTQNGAERRASREETLCRGRNLGKLIRLSKH
jgi:hypothetical protein